jgi:hypothetical protein
VGGRGLSVFIFFFHCLYLSDVWVGSYTGHSLYETLDQIKIIIVSIIIIIMALISSVRQQFLLFLCHLQVGRVRISQNLLKDA